MYSISSAALCLPLHSTIPGWTTPPYAHLMASLTEGQAGAEGGALALETNLDVNFNFVALPAWESGYAKLGIPYR